MFAGCSKDNKKDEMVPQITRFVPFYPNSYNNLTDVEKIGRMADSVAIYETLTPSQ